MFKVVCLVRYLCSISYVILDRICVLVAWDFLQSCTFFLLAAQDQTYEVLSSSIFIFFWSKPCLWLYLSSLCVSGQFIFGFKRLSVYFCKTFTGKMCNIFIFLTHVTWLISFVWLLASLCPNSNIHYLFIYCQHRKKLVLFVHIENNINIL